MPASIKQAQEMRFHSSSGEIVQFEYDGDGDPIYIGVAPFGAADDAPVWYIDKLVYVVVAGEKNPPVIQRCGTRHAWDERANMSVMGWRP